ncbi:hypothetical protein KC622_03780, partial [Candidatus Dojkabacteria bacterium]|nr:hypothetical protein [Candidatus Dojkabacteria bacterium]
QLVTILASVGDATYPAPQYWTYFQKIEGWLDIWLVLGFVFILTLAWFIYMSPMRDNSLVRRTFKFVIQDLNIQSKVRYLAPFLVFLFIILTIVAGISWIIFVNNLAPSWLARIIVSADLTLASLGVSRVFNILVFSFSSLLGITLALEAISQKDLIPKKYNLAVFSTSRRYLIWLLRKISFKLVPVIIVITILFAYFFVGISKYWGIKKSGSMTSISLKSIKKINPSAKVFKSGALSQQSLLADKIETALRIPFSRKVSDLTVKSDLKSQSDIYAEWDYKGATYGQLVYSPTLENYTQKRIDDSSLSIYWKNENIANKAQDVSLFTDLVKDNKRIGFSRYSLSNTPVSGVEDIDTERISWGDLYMTEDTLSQSFSPINSVQSYDLGDIKGEFEVYVYLSDSLEARLLYRDLNRDFGTDSFYMVLVDRNSNVMYSQKVEDDNLPIRGGESVNSIDFSIDSITPGLYRILLTTDLENSLFENSDISKYNPDLVFRSISLNSKYLVYRPLSKSWTLPKNPVNQVFDVRDRRIQLEKGDIDAFALDKDCDTEISTQFTL